METLTDLENAMILAILPYVAFFSERAGAYNDVLGISEAMSRFSWDGLVELIALPWSQWETIVR